MIHNPEEIRASLSFSRNVHKGDDRIVQNNDSLLTDSSLARPVAKILYKQQNVRLIPNETMVKSVRFPRIYKWQKKII